MSLWRTLMPSIPSSLVGSFPVRIRWDFFRLVRQFSNSILSRVKSDSFHTMEPKNRPLDVQPSGPLVEHTRSLLKDFVKAESFFSDYEFFGDFS